MDDNRNLSAFAALKQTYCYYLSGTKTDYNDLDPATNIISRRPAEIYGPLPGQNMQVWLSSAKPDIGDGNLLSAFAALKQTYYGRI